MAYAPPTFRLPTAAEQQQILSYTGERAAGYRDHMLFAMALGTALREEELCALNVGDVMDGHTARTYIQLTTYKGRGRRRKPAGNQKVPLNRQLRRKLLKFIAWKKQRGEPVEPEAPLFASALTPHQRIVTRTVRYISQESQKRAGISKPYNFHAFRHACLTTAYALTKDIIFVQSLARHQYVSTTQIYTHISDEQVAANAEKLPC